MNEFPSVMAIVDTETTGMRPPYSRIIDIGIIRIENGKEVERFQSLVHPGVSLPGSITRLTSITDTDLMTAPSFEEIALQVQELLDGAVFVAHNAPFDYAFVKSEFERLGMAFTAPALCSVKLSRTINPKARGHSLDAVIDRYGLPERERHRALPDAEAVWDFFQALPEAHDSEAIARAAAYAQGTGGRSRAARDSFTDLPTDSGVYFFYGENQELLYIGKSKHVRTRARSHFHATGNKKELRLQDETAMVSSIATSGELSALLLESALIKAQNPMYNRALRKRKQLVLAMEATNEQGYPTIQFTRGNADGVDPSILGIFRTLTQAKASLRITATAHQLCPKLLGIENGTGACFWHQLGQCAGACIGKEPVPLYAARMTEAFEKRRLRAWPYRGIVRIDEQESADTGTVLFIDNWILRGAYKYDGELVQPLFEETGAESLFEYDTYKILVRYLLHKKNARSITIITPRAFAAWKNQYEGTAPEQSHEPVIA